MKPISELTPETARKIRYVFHDIDDTITNDGKLTADAYRALWMLFEAGIKVVPVTGRPAGWCDMIVREWPVEAVIGENGAFVYYMENGKRKEFYHPSVPLESVSEKLNEIRDACLREVPGCRVSKDQPYRVCDLAIDFNEDEPRLGLEAAQKIKEVCERFGAVAKISSIHVNTWFGDYSKVDMAKLFLTQIEKETDISEKIIFFGDSPNDEPMFSFFPLSCGVSNIRPFLDRFTYLPLYLTKGQGGYGFYEAVNWILQKRKD